MPFGMTYDGLSEIEKHLVNLALGVDTLAGGDALHESGTQHSIVDTWTSGMTPPAIYFDDISVVLRQKGGASSFEDKKAIKDYINRYRLHELPAKIRSLSSTVEPARRTYILQLVKTFEVMLNTLDESVPTPSYDEKYKAATGLDKVELIDATPHRKELKASLAKAGYEAKSDKDLRNMFLKWEEEKGHIGSYKTGNVEKIDGKVVQVKFYETIKRLLEITRQRLFSQMNFGIKEYKSDLSDVGFDGFEFKPVCDVSFTGSSIYRGQGSNNAPLLKGLLEYNVDHPVTPANLIHLVGHEAMIGHYLNSAVNDLLWRAGKLPFEATMGTMCTSSASFQEGWAESALYVIYGSKKDMLVGVEQDFGVSRNDLEIVLNHADLQNVAKHNVSILHQRENKSIEQVREYLEKECVMPDPLVNKLSRVWAKDPILGPMYGPAYYLGAAVVRKAIDSVGAVRVAQVGLQTTGVLADITTFKEQIYKSNTL